MASPPSLQLTWNPHRRRAAPPVGLKNLGNSCYLNSVLQCLAFTPPLAQFCLQSHHSLLCKKLFVNRDKECGFCLIERQIFRLHNVDGPIESPSKIWKCLGVFSEHFRIGRQEDAHEFLRYAIDACHDVCLRVLKCTMNGGKSKGDEGVLGRSTVMSQIFGGALLSQVKCLGCKTESNTTDEFMDVCLDVIQSNSLKDAMIRFFHPEVLDGNNKYSCDSCKRLCVARKQMFIQQAPNVLVIQLKRFEGIHGVKINKNISFEEVLELSDFMHHTCQDPVPEYSLFGSIVHSGFSPESGHYYAYVKDASNRWYCCNDAHVALSTAKEVLSEKVYILFYLRSNPNPKPKKLGSSCNGWKSLDSTGNEVYGSKPLGMLKHANTQLNEVSTKANSTTSLNNGKMHVPQIKPITLKRPEANKITLNTNGNIGIQKKSSAGETFSTESNGKTNTGSKVEGVSIPINGKFSSGSNESSSMQTYFSMKGNERANSLDHKTYVPNGIDTAGSKKVVDDCCSFKSPSSKHPNGNLAATSETHTCIITENSAVHVQEPSNLSGEDISYSNKSSIRKRPNKDGIEKFLEVLFGEALSQLRASDWADKVENFMRHKKKLCQQSSRSGSDKSLMKKQLILEAREAFIPQVPESLKHELVEELVSFFQESPVLKT